MRHGYAVAMGLAVAARLSANLGLSDTTTRDGILAVLETYELPTHIPRELDADDILRAMSTDKKIKDGKVRLILPREIGRVEIINDVAREEIVRALEESR
jgi:3-dehydroquinate synthase